MSAVNCQRSPQKTFPDSLSDGVFKECRGLHRRPSLTHIGIGSSECGRALYRRPSLTHAGIGFYQCVRSLHRRLLFFWGGGDVFSARLPDLHRRPSLIDPWMLSIHVLTLYDFSSNRVKMSLNIGDNGNLFLKLKSKLGLYHVVLTTPKTSPGKLTLTVVEIQQLP